MSCQSVCKLCPRLIISESVLFDPTTNNLDITIPDNGYRNCDIVCIVVSQTIPTSTTINALVSVVVGGTRFPLVKCDCTQATACEIQTRTKYKTRVITNTVSGTFRLQGRIYCTRPSNLTTLPTTPAVATASVVEETQVVEPIVARTTLSAKTTPISKTTTKKEVKENE